MSQQIGSVKVITQSQPITSSSFGSVRISTGQTNPQKVISVQYLPSDTGLLNAAISASNTALIQSNIAFAEANSTVYTSNTALIQSNTAIVIANNSYTQANVAINTSNTALAEANYAILVANLAYAQANTGGVTLVDAGTF